MKPHRTLSALLIALALFAGPSAPLLSAQDSPETPKEAPVAAAAVTATNAPAAAEAVDQSDPDEDTGPKMPKHRHRNPAASDDSVVSVGKDDRVPAGRKVSEFVIILGDGVVDGDVDGDAVVVGGKLVVNGKISGNAVNVGTGLELGPKSEVKGDAVGIGGGVFRQDGSVVHGEIVPVGISVIPGLAGGIPAWVSLYLTDCLLKLRPLSFSVLWPWTVLAAFFMLHFLVAALLPGASRGVERAMSERPGATALMAVLAIPLGLFAMVLLTVTAVGPVVLLAAGLVAVLVGKVAVLQLLGGRLTSMFGAARRAPLVCFLVGALLVALLYATPYIGFFVWFALSLWGLGAVLIALLRRDSAPASNPAPAPGPSPSPSPASQESFVHAVTPGPEPALSPAFAGPASVVSPEIPVTPVQEPPRSQSTSGSPSNPFPGQPGRASTWARTASMPGIAASEIETLPRPTFLPRFGALVLDWILVGIVMGVLPDRLFLVNIENLTGPLRLMLGVAYFASMIAWRGTTLGGLLFRLQVIRLDGRPLDRATAIVRAVGAILSGAICGLGWFWALWDEDKQGWHDKFAGTVVVQVQKSKPLI
jgi:uncharacterized RDD family membrane protein YckC